MGNHERGGHNLEAEYSLGGRLFDLRSCEGTQAFASQVGGDPLQCLGQVGAGAAAGVEDVDVLGGQAVLNARSSFRARSTRATM